MQAQVLVLPVPQVWVLPVPQVPQVWEQALRVQVQVQAQASAEKATEKALPVPERGLVRVQEKKYPLPK